MIVTQSYGIAPKELGLMTLSELKPYENAYYKQMKNQVQMIDYSAWMHGVYTRMAINSSDVGNCYWVHGKGTPNNYPKVPLSEKTERKKSVDEETEEYFAMLKMKKNISMWEKQGLPQAPN